MERKEPEFADNIFVIRNRWGGNEYLSLHIKYGQDDWYNEETFEPIRLTRYCVPGRIDTYSFSWWDRPQGWGDSITYFSERHTPLPQIMKMVQNDLNRPLVVKFLKEAAEKLIPYHVNHLRMFLRQLAPASKSVKAIDRIWERKNERAKIRVQELREIRKTLETTQTEK